MIRLQNPTPCKALYIINSPRYNATVTGRVLGALTYLPNGTRLLATYLPQCCNKPVKCSDQESAIFSQSGISLTRQILRTFSTPYAMAAPLLTRVSRKNLVALAQYSQTMPLSRSATPTNAQVSRPDRLLASAGCSA